jgi:hypothetical protein
VGRSARVCGCAGAYYTDYWETARALLQDYKLIEWIAHFDADAVPARVLRKLAPLVHTPEFEAENVARVCMAAGRLARWVTAVVDHNLEKHPHLVASSPTTPIASPSPSQQRGGSMLSRANSVPNKGVVPVRALRTRGYPIAMLIGDARCVMHGMAVADHSLVTGL